MTAYGKWLLAGITLLLFVLLVIELWGVLFWIGLAWTLLGLGAWGFWLWGVIANAVLRTRQVAAETAKMQAEAEQAAAIAEQQRATAAGLWEQRRMIPATMVGLVLDAPEDRERVMIWPQGPHTVTYTGAPALPVVESDPPGLPQAEPFTRIASSIAPGHLVLGYNLMGAIPGDISDLLSTAIVGRPGTGKTTALRFVCAQVLKIGGQPMLFDPHGSIADEMGDALECAEDASSIARLAARLEQELDHRLAARREKQPIGSPMLALADEWPVIAQIAPEAVRITGRVILEGRKVGMFALVSGQGLPAEHLGGSLFRDALSSRYVFCTTPAQARLAGMDNETAKSLLARLETAGPGYAILASARRRPEIVAIPDTRPDDLRMLVGACTLPPLPVLPPLPPNPRFSSLPVSPDAQNGANEALPEKRREEKIPAAERARILELAQEGHATSEIARIMRRSSNYYYTVRQVLAEKEDGNGTDGN